MSRYVYDKEQDTLIPISGMPQIDNELDSTSENPVQNKAIIEGISPMFNILGAKNLLNNTLTNQVNYGVTYTKNSDGSISVSGTATGRFSGVSITPIISLPKGKYILSGCPSGGKVDDTVKYNLYVNDNNSTIAMDTGDGAEFELLVDTDVHAGMAIAENETVNTTYYPMIRPASVADDTYVPYTMTNRGLTETIDNKLNNNTDGSIQGTLIARQFMLGYTYNCSVLNIDTISKSEGYIIRCILGGSDNLGTLPTSIVGGNAFLLIGFSQCLSNGSVVFGVQIAIGFGASKIAIRNASYNSSGGSWSAWTAV